MNAFLSPIIKYFQLKLLDDCHTLVNIRKLCETELKLLEQMTCLAMQPGV